MEERFDIAVIGAGFAGIGAAWQLIEHGLTDFVVLERGDEVGGTWRDNSYPGAACDIKSDLYSFSFAPNPEWRWTYGRQPEILEYLVGVSHRRGIHEHIRFGVDLQQASWDAEAGRWTLLTSRGTLSVRVLLSGHGPLIDPQWPAIAGLDSFEGPRFHSSAWDHALDLGGKRVAVIGTGASAIQIVPALQSRVEKLTLFQRTPPWIISRNDRRTGRIRRRIFTRFPIVQRARRALVFTLNDSRWFGFTRPRIGAVVERVAAGHLERQVSDPALRAQLHPGYRIGCKRVLVSDDFYPAIQRENVELVTDAIERVESDAIVTRDGARREVDVIVCATGFTATRPQIAERIVGVDGRVLADVWSGGMFALRGSTVPGFPNLYILTGPNTALAHNSVVFMIEAQIHYAIDGLLRTGPGAVVEARPAATTRYNRWLDRYLAQGVWSRGGCSSFYLDASGRNTALWPLRAATFRRVTRRFDASEYRVDPAPGGVLVER